jgi:hypothetical protein
MVTSKLPRHVAAAACALFAALCALPSWAEEAANTRYVSASSMNLRAAASPTAEVRARWRINQRLTLLKESDRWCDVQSIDGTQRGHVDCAFLQRAPVTLGQIEGDTTEAALALLRQQPQAWTSGIERDPVETRRLIEALLQQFDRHFAYSPSLLTYRDINAVLSRLRDEVGGLRERAELAPLAQLLDSRIAQLPALRAAFDADFANDPRQPIRRSALGGVASLLDSRQARLRERLDDRRRVTEIAPSYFAQGRWAIGWAGGPLAQAQKPAAGEAARFALSFDGAGVWELSGTVEMAKQQRAAVRAEWGSLTGEAVGLSQAQNNAASAVDTLRLETRLQAWGITERGLVPATVRGAGYFGGACANEGDSQKTRADVEFSAPVPGALLAVFASSAPIDPSRVRVHVQRRSVLAPLWDLFENTLTDRQTLTVDLDADGVADLRVVVSNDSAVGLAPQRQLVAYRNVAGWYANDVYSLEANVDGAWRMLSRYSVSTCT